MHSLPQKNKKGKVVVYKNIVTKTIKYWKKQYIGYGVVYCFSNIVIVFPIILLFFQYK